VARKLRGITNKFGSRKNGIESHFYSAVKDIEKELIKNDMELRNKAADVVIATTRRKLAAGGEGIPKEERKSFTRGLKKKTQRYYTAVGIGKPGFHAMNVEYGHDVVRDGKKIGEAAPHPFFKPSWEEAAPKIKSILSEKRISDD
jgi:hypothetical protein